MTQILSACATNELDKLRIMDLAYLSDRQARVYLSRLVSDGVLKYDTDLKRYRTTEAGLKVLDGHT